MYGAQPRGNYALAGPASSGGVKVGDSRTLNSAVAPSSTSTRNFHTCQFFLPSSLCLSRSDSPGKLVPWNVLINADADECLIQAWRWTAKQLGRQV